MRFCILTDFLRVMILCVLFNHNNDNTANIAYPSIREKRPIVLYVDKMSRKFIILYQNRVI